MFWRSSAIPHHQAEDLENIVFLFFFKVFQWILLEYLFFESLLIDFAEIFVYCMDFDETLAPEVGGQPVSPPTTSWLKTSRTLFFLFFDLFFKVLRYI